MAHSESLRSVRLIQIPSTVFTHTHWHWDALQGSIEHEHPWIFRESTALESSTPQLQHWSQVNRWISGFSATSVGCTQSKASPDPIPHTCNVSKCTKTGLLNVHWREKNTALEIAPKTIPHNYGPGSRLKRMLNLHPADATFTSGGCKISGVLRRMEKRHLARTHNK